MLVGLKTCLLNLCVVVILRDSFLWELIRRGCQWQGQSCRVTSGRGRGRVLKWCDWAIRLITTFRVRSLFQLIIKSADLFLFLRILDHTGEGLEWLRRALLDLRATWRLRACILLLGGLSGRVLQNFGQRRLLKIIIWYGMLMYPIQLVERIITWCRRICSLMDWIALLDPLCWLATRIVLEYLVTTSLIFYSRCITAIWGLKVK